MTKDEIRQIVIAALAEHSLTGDVDVSSDSTDSATLDYYKSLVANDSTALAEQELLIDFFSQLDIDSIVDEIIENT